MTLRIKGAQKMKLKNIPLIVLSNLTIAQCYHKAVEKTPHLVEALQTRFLEVTLTEPLDLDNIVWPTQENTAVQPAMEQSAIPQETPTSNPSTSTRAKHPKVRGVPVMAGNAPVPVALLGSLVD